MTTTTDTAAPERILYVCTRCARRDVDICGYFDRADLGVAPTGDWLCRDCQRCVLDDWKALPVPPEYGPVSARVVIDYTNHRGERGERAVIPTGRLLPGDAVYHPDARWVIEALDIAKGEMRTFDPARIHRWGGAEARPDLPATPQPAPEPAGLARAARAALDEIDALMNETEGVAGLHRNGDVATWDELVEGGQYERIGAIEALRTALAAERDGGRG